MRSFCAIVLCFAVWSVAGTPPVSADDEIEHMLLPYGFTDRHYEVRKQRATSPLDQTNPLKLMFVLLIRGYQVIFSSQDGASCQFRPSCSHFGADAIKKHGPVQGLLMTSDRLLRCNPYTRGKYPYAEDHYHHKDPVKDHLLCGSKAE